jgi:hypothetical protein
MEVRTIDPRDGGMIDPKVGIGAAVESVGRSDGARRKTINKTPIEIIEKTTTMQGEVTTKVHERGGLLEDANGAQALITVRRMRRALPGKAESMTNTIGGAVSVNVGPILRSVLVVRGMPIMKIIPLRKRKEEDVTRRGSAGVVDLWKRDRSSQTTPPPITISISISPRQKMRAKIRQVRQMKIGNRNPPKSPMAAGLVNEMK